MIKKLAVFIVAFLVVSFLYFSLVYLIGLLLQEMGIALYDSESDQQRNFNVVLGVWLAVSVGAGVWRIKKNS
ncbi:hypothetical protein [Ketobacter alkanivorans]|uniref:Uncharacterized protein n=1 Tax=Ketobacter alkanivorans TaxID=1917421 RepID=A0A2K9LJY0_9GAMM|nr:hypothetical protein [Ketobacter alkanivorans]AUM12648.1 hypothetical protein Kalk_09580 [Ketobacter alkanivorans]